MTLRIAHVGPTTLPIWHSRGGALQRRMIEIGRAQLSMGDDVLLISAGRGDGGPNHGDPHTDSIPCHLARPWRDGEFLIRVQRVLKRFRPDIVHFHGVPYGAALARPSVPSILTVDYFEFSGSHSVLGHVAYARCLRQYAAITAVSEYCRIAFQRFWTNAPQPEVVPNGVNLRQFSPDHEAGMRTRSRLGVPATAPVVLYVGRVCTQKGSDTLAAAVRNLRAQVGNAQIVVAGPPGQFGRTGRDPLMHALHAAGAQCIGAVSDDELHGIYNMCDVFVMPTRSDEMFGMAVVEAEACGKAIVCSRLGGLVEAASEQSAIFVTPGDPTALADAIIEVLTDTERRRRMAVAASDHVRQFDWGTVARAFRRVYEHALDTSR